MSNRSRIRWVRVIVAGFLSEASVVLCIGLVVLSYRYLASPSDAAYHAFSDRLGFYAGVFGGGVAAFALALWVCRSLKSHFLANGALVGCMAAMLHIALVTLSGAPFQTAYLVADVLKVIGGALGGYLGMRNARTGP